MPQNQNDDCRDAHELRDGHGTVAAPTTTQWPTRGEYEEEELGAELKTDRPDGHQHAACSDFNERDIAFSRHGIPTLL